VERKRGVYGRARECVDAGMICVRSARNSEEPRFKKGLLELTKSSEPDPAFETGIILFEEATNL
jgi:hypothetical protein